MEEKVEIQNGDYYMANELRQLEVLIGFLKLRFSLDSDLRVCSLGLGTETSVFKVLAGRGSANAGTLRDWRRRSRRIAKTKAPS